AERDRHLPEDTAGAPEMIDDTQEASRMQMPSETSFTQPQSGGPLAEQASRPVRITADKISVFYGEKQALFDVSVHVPDRAVTAFIGPSGCGKSTFLRCFNRMNDTIEGARVTGRIELDGEDIYDSALDVVEL